MCDIPKYRYKRRPSSSSASVEPASRKMSSSEFPPLPLIIGDLLLETFSHKSLNLEYNPELSTDNRRLIELGRTALEFAATRYLYSKRPIVAASEIPDLKGEILSDDNYESWVTHYNLRQKLRYVPSKDLDISSPEETKQLFQAFVGALVAQSGSQIATNWVIQIIDPNAAVLPSPDEEDDTEDHRASKRPRSQPAPPAPPPAPAESPPPAPAGPPPPSTPTTNTPNRTYYAAAQVTNGSPATTASPIISPEVTPSKLSSKFLPAFNQRCSQQHLQVEYQAANHATPHAPLWVMKCFVNSVLKGEGQGSSKQVAKEAAARQAYYAMGWAIYGVPS